MRTSLRRYHWVTEGEHDDNTMRLRLPGTQRSWPGQERFALRKVAQRFFATCWPGMPLYFQLDTLREWRKAMLLPPRTSDVYRAANQVGTIRLCMPLLA